MIRPIRFLSLGFVAAGASVLAGLASAQAPSLLSLENQFRAQAQTELAQARFLAQLHNWPTTTVLPNGQKLSLIRVENGRPVYYGTRDRASALTISADDVWPGGVTGFNLTGAGVTVGVWDAGAVFEHAEFAGRLSFGDDAFPDFHATAVAGSAGAAGVNPQARSIAYQSSILSYDWFADNAELAAAANSGLRVSNHSYGPVQGWVFGGQGDDRWAWNGDPTISEVDDWKLGAYWGEALRWDQIAFAAPFLNIVIAAGNMRLSGPATQPVEHWVFTGGSWQLNTTAVRNRNGGPLGFGSIAHDTTAKNAITVGATEKNPAGYTGPNSVRMSDFSDWGPVDDGRIKPDVVAPGVSMLVPAIGGGYTNVDGTSFAAPIVAGAIAVLTQQYQRSFARSARASTIKGLLCHTADEAGPFPGPDYAFGWGQVNLASAATIVANSVFAPQFLQELRLTSGQVRNIPLSFGSGGDLKVTICWTDPIGPAQPPSNNNRTFRALQNDLDIRVIRNSDGRTFLPWRLSPDQPTAPAAQSDNNVDNVEQVFVPAAQLTSGDYTIRISHKGGALRPSGSQDFSLIISAPAAGRIQSLSIDPTTVLGGIQNAFGVVTLRGPAEGPEIVNLRSNNPNAATVPATVTIPNGQSSASFLITTRSVQTTQDVSILAGGVGGTANASLTVRPVTLGAPGIQLEQSSAVGGTRVLATVNLNGPAPTGGATVTFRSSNPTAAVPERNWILIPAGQSQGRVFIRTNPVPENRAATITVTRGSLTGSAALTVLRPSLTGLTPSATTLAGGSVLNLTVNLDGRAPSVGAVVQLASSNAQIVPVPASIRVPAGATTARATIITRRPSVSTPVTITASRLGDTLTTNVTVQP